MAASYPNVTEEDLNGFRFSVDQILTTVEKVSLTIHNPRPFIYLFTYLFGLLLLLLLFLIP